MIKEFRYEVILEEIVLGLCVLGGLCVWWRVVVKGSCFNRKVLVFCNKCFKNICYK